MNKFLVNGITSALMSLGLSSGAVQAYSSYSSRLYAPSRSLSLSQDPGRHVPKLSRTEEVGMRKGSTPLAPVDMVSVASHVNELVLQKNQFNESSNIEPDDRLDRQGELSILKSGPVKELVIVDQAVPDKHVFYKDLKQGVEIVEINSREDGFSPAKANSR